MAYLKSCPICGKEVRLVPNDNPPLFRPSRNGRFHIECYECDLLFGYDVDYGGQFMSEEEAIEAWNRRE